MKDSGKKTRSFTKKLANRKANGLWRKLFTPITCGGLGEKPFCEKNPKYKICCWDCEDLEDCIPKWERFLKSCYSDPENCVCPISKENRWCSYVLEKWKELHGVPKKESK